MMYLNKLGISPKSRVEDKCTCISDLSLTMISRKDILESSGKIGLLMAVCCIIRDINSLIMDYLINEGYPSAAQKFAAEANIPPTGDTESIQERVEIRNAIHSGDIQTAIEKINDLNPQVSKI